ncbi:MAG: serine O-acetyltransferase [Solirubrobacterales bacterium]|nr:serine O-acetyltransferase [Solirubrobacterales bacterium]
MALPGIQLFSKVANEIRHDVTAAIERDPAARGVGSPTILALWPGVHAILAHRVAHALHSSGVPIAPRVIAAGTRFVTGVEIHPAAEIGEGLFIDHGMGVVIGETSSIGSNVTIYQGVTLGGTGFAGGKRHPTVGDDVTIGSGAKLLGPIEVGDRAKIGANSVVIHDVPEGATVVGNPGHPVRVDGERPTGPDADWAHLPDPVADALGSLAVRLDAVERELGSKPAEVRRLTPRRGPTSAGG